MTVREWNRDTDTALIAEWLRVHNGQPFEPAILPPTGVIAEDDTGPLAACWIYLSYGIGVAFVEMAISRPGLSLAKSRKAFAAVMGALEEVAKAHNTGVLVCHTLPAVARILKADGWTFAEKPALIGTKTIPLP